MKPHRTTSTARRAGNGHPASQNGGEGWAWILSALKTLVETGLPLTAAT